VDDRSDIFSLGVVLYEMATGQRPFTGDNSTSILTSVLRDTPPPVRDVRGELPRHLGRIVRRCLQKDPERRYHHAKDLRNDLEELKAELDSGQLEQPAIPPIPHARRSRFGILLAVGVAAIVLAAVSYSLFIGLGRQSGNSNVAWEIKPLTRSEGHHNSPSWSPDGSLVAFSRVDSGYPRVYVMATGGGEPMLLTDSPGDHSLPRWSRDGQQIAFVTERGDGAKIYLAPPLGGEERELVTTDLVFDLAKEHTLGATPWSPDGRAIAYFVRRGSGGVIRAVDPDGSNARDLVPEWRQTGVEHEFDWYRDSRHIVYTRRPQDGASGLELVVRSLDTGPSTAYAPRRADATARYEVFAERNETFLALREMCPPAEVAAAARAAGGIHELVRKLWRTVRRAHRQHLGVIVSQQSGVGAIEFHTRQGGHVHRLRTVEHL
jgi:hypothetical protein